MTRDRKHKSSRQAGDLCGHCKSAGMHCAVFLVCAWKKENGSASLWFPSTALALGKQTTHSAAKTAQTTEGSEAETLLAVGQKVKRINKHSLRSHLKSC